MDWLRSYDQLLARRDAPPGSSWHIFGEHDEIGTVNMLTSERVRRAATLVRTGKSFNLDYRINGFNPPVTRQLASHKVFEVHGDSRDDYLDNFYLAQTSQIDGLRHSAHPQAGFYGGVAPSEIREGTEVLGMHRWAERGIVGRGVLLDIERFLEAKGTALDYRRGEAFTVELLDDVAHSCGVGFENGDILLIRTGWSRYYLDEMTPVEKLGLRRELRSPGLVQSRATLKWLWDHHFALVASDTIAVEALPAVPDAAFSSYFKGLMHQELIALLGLCLGELWNLDDLAVECAADGVFECMVVAKPLNVVGGVNSPPNALALK